MVEIVRGKESGKLYAKLGGNEYVPLQNEDEARIVLEGGVEALAQSAGNAIGQIATGAGSLLGVPGARESFDELQRNQDLRTQGNPIAGTAGQFLPDVALGVATGGSGTLAKRAIQTGIVEGAVGAARNPDAPLTGALIQGGLGAVSAGALPVSANVVGNGARRGADLANNVINRTRGNNAVRAQNRALREAAETGRPINSAARNVADGSMGAARNATPSGALSEKVLGRGTLDSDYMLERYGMPTSQAQKTIIDTTDPAAFTAARNADNENFNEWRSRGGGKGILKDAFDPIDNYGDLRATQQDALNRNVMAAMGSNKVTASRANVGEARKAISNSYNDIAARAGNLDVTEDIATMNRLIEEAGEGTIVRNTLEETRDNILRRAGALGGGVADAQGAVIISADDFMALKNKIAKDMKNAYGREPNLEKGDALRDVDGLLDTRLMQSLDPEDQAQLRTNRQQWGVANSALRTTAATNARGDVNLRSFINAYRTGNRRFKIGYDNSEFAQFLDTADAIMFKETRDSGTPQGIAPVIGAAIRSAAGSATGLPL